MFWGGIFYDEYGNMQGVRASSLWREKEMNKLHGLCSIWCTRDMLMCAEGNGPSLRVGGRIRCVQYHVPRKKKDAGEQACSLLWPQPFRHPLSTDHPPARSTFANVKDARAETSWGHTSPRANSTERVPGESKNGSDFHPNSKIIMRRQDDGANDREIPQILVLLIQDNKTSRQTRALRKDPDSIKNIFTPQHDYPRTMSRWRTRLSCCRRAKSGERRRCATAFWHSRVPCTGRCH